VVHRSVVLAFRSEQFQPVGVGADEKYSLPTSVAPSVAVAVVGPPLGRTATSRASV
jgi:hypothetical protein